MIAAEQMRAAAALLSSAERVALACHIGPDGDALGSMLAMTIALHDRGVDTIASFSDPFAIPRQYTFLPRLELVTDPTGFPAAPAVAMTFDAGSIDRLGTLTPNVRAAAACVVVDHHVSNEGFGTINLVDHDAAASAVVVRALLAAMDIPLTAEIATCLYTGLVTDTGRFQYRNTTPAVHTLAGELIAAGAPHDRITDIVYNTHPVGYLTLAGDALGRLHLRPEASMAWTFVTQDDLGRNGVGMDDIEGLIDLVRTADGADVAAVLKEQPDGRYKVSMRSRGASDVGAVCTRFGGGGHTLAAGYTSDGTEPAAIIDQIVAALLDGRA